MGVAIFILCLFFFRNRPPKPPSSTAFATIDKPGQFKKSIVNLLSNRNMLVLMLAFGQIQGTFNTLGTIVGEATAKYGFSNDDASLFGALFIVGGIIGSVVFGIYVENTRKYKLSVFLICFMSFGSTLGSYFAIPSGKTWLVSVLCFFQGFSMVPIMAVAFDFGVEITYPIGESFSTGVLMSAGQFFGIIYTVSSSVLIDNKQEKGTDLSYIIMAAACFVATIVSLFVTQNLKRTEEEQRQKEVTDP
jgi:FLVCR family feline leukemia virus subgroup C receptor-related protein